MATGPFLEKEILNKIAELYVRNKKIEGKEMHTAINTWLRDDTQFERQIALSTIQRELAKYHKTEKRRGVNPPIQFWSMGSLVRYDLPTGAIPILLAIQNDRRQNRQPLLTIDEAQWVGRLSALFEHQEIDLKQPTSLSVISTWAQAYALREKVCNLVGNDCDDCDTSDLDQSLSSDFSIALEKWEWRYLLDAIKGHQIKDDKTFRTTIYTLETMQLEMEFLRYWLGRPDLDLDGWDMYLQILQLSPESVKSVLHTSPEHARQYFISLREWVKQNPEWVERHPRTGDEVGEQEKQLMAKDCSEVASKILSSIKRGQGKKRVVKENVSAIQIAGNIGKSIAKNWEAANANTLQSKDGGK